jgi:streptogramin lyase
MKVILWLLLSCLPCLAQDFQRMGVYRGLGALVASTVGPGPVAGSQRLYLSYLYYDNTIDVVAVDPETGACKVYPNPAPTESGARCMALGPDHCLYLGTLPAAHFLKLDPKADTLVDLGRPSQSEEYIWDAAFGADQKLYGVTFPQAKLVRYDPASGKMEDLGRMDPTEMYAHFVAGDVDGFVYAGIGTSKANIAAYEIATGEHREILPAAFQTAGQARVYRGRDGQAYGTLGDIHFRLKGWTAIQLKAGEAPPPVASDALSDGRTISVSEHDLTLTVPATQKTISRTFDYAGNLLNVFRIGFGPDGRLYGSSVLPLNLLRLDDVNGKVSELGGVGGGEIYSFLSHGGRLLAAAYAGFAPLMSFDPSKPFQQGVPEKNPALVSFKNCDGGWRPEAMIEGPDGNVLVGAVSGYGKLGGPLVVWNVGANKVDQYQNLMQDQSVITLAMWQKWVVGGTTIEGGGGSHSSATEARLFLWDPAACKKVFETTPVAGAVRINDLITASNGLVYGMAGGTMFVFDPALREVKHRGKMPFTGDIYNAVAIGPDGKIWGLSSSGIFVIDPETYGVKIIAKPPKPITAGFAMSGRTVYFVCGPEIWRWTPRPGTGAKE